MGQGYVEQYVRCAVGPTGTGALVHRVQATRFDALGRVSRVSTPTRFRVLVLPAQPTPPRPPARQPASLPARHGAAAWL